MWKTLFSEKNFYDLAMDEKNWSHRGEGYLRLSPSDDYPVITERPKLMEKHLYMSFDEQDFSNKVSSYDKYNYS